MELVKLHLCKGAHNKWRIKDAASGHFSPFCACSLTYKPNLHMAVCNMINSLIIHPDKQNTAVHQHYYH